MKISIIIPAYNAEKTIEKCLDSILNQTYKNLEIIVVNDGSIDSTDKILKEYELKDSRIIYVNNSNHGVSYSRNCGIDIATGDYVTFVDSDDYLEANCYSELVEILKKEKVDFCRYNFEVDGKGGFDSNMYNLSNKKFYLPEDKEIMNHFFYSEEKIPCLVMLLLIKKSIISKIRFNESLTMMEDVDFYFQLFSVSKSVYFYDKKLYNYYINSSSVSHDSKNFKKNIFGILNTNISLKDRISKEKVIKLDLDKIDVNHLRIILNYLKEQYISNKKIYKEILLDLKKDSRFNKLLDFYKFFSIRNKIYLFLIKHNMFLISNIYLNIFLSLKKIKSR